MKIRCLALISMALILVSVAQPIFAEKPGMGTVIAKEDGNFFDTDPLNHTTFYSDQKIKLKAKLLNSEYLFYMSCRYLNFYVYRINKNKSIGELVHQDRKLTNLFTGIAATDDFVLDKGDYKAVIVYEGNGRDNIEPSNATLNILVA